MKPKTLTQDWQTITVDDNCTFEGALSVINKGGYQLALVTDNSGHLAGMITDSDIRKALLRGIGISDSVKSLMNRTPLVAAPEMAEIEAHQLMLMNHFFHLPIVDHNGLLVGLHVAEQLKIPPERSETLVIMAGGRGQRLMPLTANQPKPMLPINGKPILEHILEGAKNEGFKKIAISVNYLAEKIIDYFSDGSELGLSITYIKENKPLGTAGSLSLLPKQLTKSPIVVTNGDVITDVSYVDMIHQTQRDHADGTMAVRMQEWQNPFGVVISEGNRLEALEEKPIYRHQVNAGIYVLTPPLLKILQENEYCDMTDLFQIGINKGLNLRIFPLHESWLDIGRPDDYKAAGGTIG